MEFTPFMYQLSPASWSLEYTMLVSPSPLLPSQYPSRQSDLRGLYKPPAIIHENATCMHPYTHETLGYLFTLITECSRISVHSV